MKRISILLLLILAGFLLNAQDRSAAIQTQTKTSLAKLTAEVKFCYTPILKNRDQYHFYHRIDSLKFDYVFIEESFCMKDSSSFLTERYFTGHDSMPAFVFENGRSSEPTGFYQYSPLGLPYEMRHYYTFQPMLERFSALLPDQTIQYNQVIYIARRYADPKSTEALCQHYTQRYKSTYQIQTLINMKLQKVVVSVQLPAENPQFEIKTYDDYWGW